MAFSFENLKKIPQEPAARMLAACNTRLETVTALPASAPVEDVLRALSGEDAYFDILTLLSVALPKREAVWWACLAARDMTADPKASMPVPLAAAERWVFKPNQENRSAARVAMELADMHDDTVYCAMAAFYADGNMGEGDMAKIDAPPGAVSGAVVCMNMIALAEKADEMQPYLETLIARGLDIARGGNGQVAPPQADPAPQGET